MAFATGQRLDDYEIISVLGAGGMSEVYLARDPHTNRRVVLKVPHAQLIGDPALFTRLQREIAIGQRLAHPNIQQLLTTGRAGNGLAPYLVLEYVEGESLRHYLAAHAPLPVEQAVDFSLQLAAALAYCHEQGVIHRDLKPENVLVTPEGQLKLMDFGIALLQGARRVTWQSLSSTVGTPDYMAPEQVRGERGDERTDIYAVATILYEMLAGQVPFQGDNSLAIMSQRVEHDPPRLRAVRPDVPPGVEATVARALARDPERRYATMADFAHDLAHPDAVDLHYDPSSAPQSRRLSPAVQTAIIIVLTFTVIVLLAVIAQLMHGGQ